MEIKRGTWTELPIYGVMQSLGNVEDKEMFRTFNMGVGMVIVCEEENKAAIVGHLGDECKEIGRVVEGEKEVRIN